MAGEAGRRIEVRIRSLDFVRDSVIRLPISSASINMLFESTRQSYGRFILP